MARFKRSATIEDRLRAQTKETDSGCTEWTGHTADGYGMIRRGTGRVRAHRVAFELAHGPIPIGLCVLHRCDNRRCVRVDHLFLGTRADNNADKTVKGRQARGPGHGRAGSRHPSARLSMQDVEAIRAASGVAQRALAARFGVSQTHISYIRNGRRWRS